jgi:hypothetical protein
MLESPCPFPLLAIGPLICCDTARLTDGAERRRSRRTLCDGNGRSCRLSRPYKVQALISLRREALTNHDVADSICGEGAGRCSEHEGW